MRRLLTGAMALAVLIPLCGCGGRSDGDEAKKPAAPAEQPPAAGPTVPRPAPPRLPSVPKLPAPAKSESSEFQEQGQVEWTLSPENAVIRISHGKTTTVVTAELGRATTPVSIGFHTVEVSAPGYETWIRRMALGGSTTSHVVTLQPLPPEPDPSTIAEATPPPAPEETPYFPKRENLRKLELPDIDPIATIAQIPAAEPAVESVPIAAAGEPIPAPLPPPEMPTAEPAVESAPIASAVESVPMPLPPPEMPSAEPAVESVPIAAAGEPIPAPLPPPEMPTAEPAVESVPIASAVEPVPAPLPPPEMPSAEPAVESVPIASAVKPVPATLPPPEMPSAPPPIPVPAVLSPAPPAAEPVGPRTQFVRVLLESTLAGDDGLASAPKTLSIGNETRSFRGVTMTLPYAEVGNRPIQVRIRNYDVFAPAANPGAIAPADASDGIATLVFRAVPHPARIRFPKLPDNAEIWDPSMGRPRPDFDARTRTLSRWTPGAVAPVQIRCRGMRPLTLDLGPLPAGGTADCAAELLGLPVYGKPGDRCALDLGGGCDLSLVWVPGGPVTEPPTPGARPFPARILPRGFWLSETPVTWHQWTALAGLQSPPNGNRPVEIARPRFAEFAMALQSAVPRLTVRLPSRIELLRASQSGVGGIATGSELTLQSSADATTPRPAGTFHVVLAAGLPPLPQ